MEDRDVGGLVTLYVEGSLQKAYYDLARLTYARWEEEGRDMSFYTMERIMHALMGDVLRHGLAACTQRERRLDRNVRGG